MHWIYGALKMYPMLLLLLMTLMMMTIMMMMMTLCIYALSSTVAMFVYSVGSLVFGVGHTQIILHASSVTQMSSRSMSLGLVHAQAQAQERKKLTSWSDTLPAMHPTYPDMFNQTVFSLGTYCSTQLNSHTVYMQVLDF